MVESSYDIRAIQIFHKRYTDYIISFERHAERLYDNWIIDINDRNQILQKLDKLIREMIKIYNDTIVRCDNTIPVSGPLQRRHMKIHDKIYDKIHDGLSIIKSIDRNLPMDPFLKIRNELIDLCKDYGFWSIDDFLKLIINENYAITVNEINEEIYDLYNQIFVTVGINCDPSKFQHILNVNRLKLSVAKIESKYDSLLDNVCQVTIVLDNVHTIVFEGYIHTNPLNIHSRTSQIYCNHLFQLKQQVKMDIMHKNRGISADFITKYNQYMSNCSYFILSSEDMANKIIRDHEFYSKLMNNSRNINLLVRDFVNSDIKIMFQVLSLLLIGDRQCIVQAVFLFSLLKDHRVRGGNLSDIIYHHLSFHSQIKLLNNTRNFKIETDRLKTLTPETISIEKKLAAAVNMPESVKAYIIEKNNEVKSGENNYKLQVAINGLMQFPWKPINSAPEYADIEGSIVRSREYLQNIARTLDSTVYGHNDSKKLIIEEVGEWIQNSGSDSQIIGFTGPKGVGKTLFAKSIAAALKIPLAVIGLGGMNDSADLVGHSFTYAGAQYGMIIRQMIKAGSWRCILFFDEVDKVAKRNETNEIYHTLIHITDTNMNKNFQDRFYSSSIEFDLSGALIIFSYNDPEKLDPILLDRIKEIKVSAYSTSEKISISQNYILKELCTSIRFARERIYFSDETIKYIVEKYTSEAGVRELKRKLKQIIQKLNIDRFYLRGPFRDIMRKRCLEINPTLIIDDPTDDCDAFPENCGDIIKSYVEYVKSSYEDLLSQEMLNDIFNLNFEDKIEICLKYVHRYLGEPQIQPERIHTENMIGIINGLYATTGGMGGIVPIQIYKNHIASHETENRLKITGNQKQIMRESVFCALTIAINILKRDIRDTVMQNFPHGFHVHAPDGSTPKDGPSAGCAFTTAFVSILLNKKINHEVAMTGEIELTGKINKIGGLYSKLSGAKKAGVKVVYICRDNEDDYKSIRKKNPDLFDADFEIRIIDHILDIVTDPFVIIDTDKSNFQL